MERTVHDLGDEAARQVLAERAARLARVQNQSERAPHIAMVVASLGEQRVAISAADLLQSLPPARCTALPPGGPLVALRAIRGRIVPIAPLDALVGAQPSSLPIEERPILALRDGDDVLGVLVDELRGMKSVPLDHLTPSPEDQTNATPVIGVDSTGTLVLDVRRLLDAALTVRTDLDDQGAM